MSRHTQILRCRLRFQTAQLVVAQRDSLAVAQMRLVLAMLIWQRQLVGGMTRWRESRSRRTTARWCSCQACRLVPRPFHSGGWPSAWNWLGFGWLWDWYWMSCQFHSGLFVCSRTLYAVLAMLYCGIAVIHYIWVLCHLHGKGRREVGSWYYWGSAWSRSRLRLAIWHKAFQKLIEWLCGFCSRNWIGPCRQWLPWGCSGCTPDRRRLQLLPRSHRVSQETMQVKVLFGLPDAWYPRSSMAMRHRTPVLCRSAPGPRYYR